MQISETGAKRMVPVVPSDRIAMAMKQFNLRVRNRFFTLKVAEP